MPDLPDDSDLDLPPEWQDFPADAKYGVLFCAAGWVCHLLLFGGYIFHKYTGEIPQNELLKHLVLAGVICFFLYRGKPWARWFAIMGNTIVILYYLAWGVGINWQALDLVVMAITSLLFILSTVFFFKKEARQFFKRKIESDVV
jgi:hypothetical protein